MHRFDVLAHKTASKEHETLARERGRLNIYVSHLFL